MTTIQIIQKDKKFYVRKLWFGILPLTGILNSVAGELESFTTLEEARKGAQQIYGIQKTATIIEEYMI